MHWLAADYYWQLMWQPESVTEKNGGHYAVVGGVSVPTKVNPSLAKEIETKVSNFGTTYYSVSFYKEAIIRTFIRHPIKWLSIKAQYISFAWFDDFGGPKGKAWQVENWFYACMVCFLVSLACVRIFLLSRNFKSNLIAEVFFLGIVLLEFLCGIFFHFEPRYLYPLKIISVMMMAVYLAMFINIHKQASL